jgi:hypothetical protein
MMILDPCRIGIETILKGQILSRSEGRTSVSSARHVWSVMFMRLRQFGARTGGRIMDNGL